MNTRGISVIEAMVAAVITLTSLVTAAKLFDYQMRESLRVQNLTSAGQIEREIRAAVASRAKAYFLAAAVGSPLCTDQGVINYTASVNNAFANTMQFVLPSGITTQFMFPAVHDTVMAAITDGDNLPGQTFQDPRRARTISAMTRCAGETDFAGGFAPAASLHWCLYLVPPTPAANTHPGPDDILDSSALFAEFALVVMDRPNNALIPCQIFQTPHDYTSAAGEKRVIWSLYYTIYWNRRTQNGRLFGDYVGMYSMGD